MDKKSLTLTTKLLKFVYPQAKSLIRLLQLGNGYLNMPPVVIDAMTREGLPPWSTFYECPNRLKSLMLFAAVGNKNANGLIKRIKTMDEERLQRFRKFVVKLALRMEERGLADELFNIRIVSPAVFDRWFRTLSSDAQLDYWKDYYLVMYAFVANYINLLALITFGSTMCDLVARAKKGEDLAFFQAVQIDKSVLTGIPYFRSRFERASLGYEPEFLRQLALRIQDRSIAGKIKHKNLMIMLAALEEEGFFNLSTSQKYDILSDIGVYGPKHHQYDEDSLRKVLERYSSRTGREIRI